MITRHTREQDRPNDDPLRSHLLLFRCFEEVKENKKKRDELINKTRRGSMPEEREAVSKKKKFLASMNGGKIISIIEQPIFFSLRTLTLDLHARNAVKNYPVLQAKNFKNGTIFLIIGMIHLLYFIFSDFLILTFFKTLNSVARYK